MLNTTIADIPQHQNSPTARSTARSTTADATRTEQLSRALAPTVYCPESRVDECVAEAKHGLST